MSTVFEQAGITGSSSGSNGAGIAKGHVYSPLGLNAQKVIAKRYSMKDENGVAIETWEDIVRRVVGHVSTAETDQQKRDIFYREMSHVMLAR